MAVLSGREKVTIFLAVLGPEISAKILRYLPEEMAMLIASGVNKIVPSKEAVGLVLRDFGRLFLASGGAQLTLKDSESAPKKELSFEELLKSLSPKQVYNFLSTERIQTIAFVLAKITPLPSAGILALFSPEIRTKVEIAIEKIKNLSFSEKFIVPIQNILKNKMVEAAAYGTNQKRIS